MECKYETTGWYEGIKRCLGTKEVDPCPGYEKCQHFKPYRMTIADRIRAMTDEELAEQFSVFALACVNISVPGEHELADNFVQSTIDWLKQPAEV